jgi:hypothetical protein
MEFNILFEAFEYGSFGALGESTAYVNKETGEYYIVADFGDTLEELPEDLGSDKYLVLPHKNELDLGKNLALRFAEEYLPGEVKEVRDMFRRRGAYASFKSLLGYRGMLDQWHEFERQAQEEALREWCEGEEIELEG